MTRRTGCGTFGMQKLDNNSETLFDREIMRRCLTLAVESGKDSEYPFGAIITRAGEIVIESTSRVAHEHDVTRHAELIAISKAQKLLGSTSLAECNLYSTSEPCALCAYAIRESRIGRVIYALQAPLTGGRSKWNILSDASLSESLPEVFDPPPEIVTGFMAEEVDRALFDWDRLVWGTIRRRGLFVPTPFESVNQRIPGHPKNLLRTYFRLLRRMVFDRFGRTV